jgi:beta-lactamase superfamily II metal-dependent hydrolase
MRQQIALLMASMCVANVAGAATAKPLDIYYIDTEGGQATLFVAPNGKTVLVDTGNSGARDPQRIAEVAKVANVTQIDYLLVTHYHGDHVGGYLELAKLLPIRNFVDHGVTVQPEQNIPAKQAYDAAIQANPHIVPKPGDKLPIGGGVEWTIVSSAGQTLTKALAGGPGAGAKNPWCATHKPKEVTMDLENGQSVGSVIEYGKFRTVDLGDLLWDWEAKLACPVNVIGTVDLYLTTHHGMNWSGAPALVYALHPRVAIMNNGNRKGAAVETFQTLEAAPGLEDLWQLHWSVGGSLEHNAPGVFIANLEAPATAADIVLNPPPAPTPGVRPPTIGNPDHSPAWWIKVSAQQDGSFTVTNTRNGFSKTYGTQR